MGKKKQKRTADVDSADGERSSKKTQREEPADDFMEVGKEVVPGMRLRCICRGHTGTIGRIAWSPCGRFIASPSTDKTVRIWDASDGTCAKVLGRHSARVVSVAWNPDGLTLASGGDDGTVVLWKLNAGKSERTFEARAGIRSVAFAPNGRAIIWGGDNGIIEYWEEGKTAADLVYKGANINTLAWSPDASIFASGNISNEVTTWDAETRRTLTTQSAHSGKVLTCGSAYGTIRSLTWNEESTIASSWEICRTIARESV